MKKILLRVLMAILLLAFAGGDIYLFLKTKNLESDNQTLRSQTAVLQQTLDAIGPLGLAYTINTDVKPGDAVLLEDIVEVTIPVSVMNDRYITSIDELKDAYYKIGLKPTTLLTKDMFMYEDYTNTVYEKDLYFGSIPLGLEVGDYIDVRCILPGGEEYMLLSHKRVYLLVDKVIKVKLTEAELALFTSAIVDQAMHRSVGFNILITKYVEPGLLATPIPFYPVRADAEDIVILNPNIKDKSVCINSALRKDIDNRIMSYYQNNQKPQTTSIASAWSQYDSQITNAYNMYYNMKMNEEGDDYDATELNGEGEGVNIDGTIEMDFNNQTGDSIDIIDQVNQNLSDIIQQQQPTTSIQEQETTQQTGMPETKPTTVGDTIKSTETTSEREIEIETTKNNYNNGVGSDANGNNSAITNDDREEASGEQLVTEEIIE